MNAPKDIKHPRIYEYVLPGGWNVLAGKTDEDNDILSTRMVQHGDWWFHVRGVEDSHVILKEKPDAEPTAETLKQAAAIAAYHSKARSGGVVPVVCTRGRYVTKPRNAKPGAVVIRREIIYKVRPMLPDAAEKDDIS